MCSSYLNNKCFINKPCNLENFEDGLLEIYDMTDKMIGHYNIDTKANMLHIGLSDFSPGLYYYQISTPEGIIKQDKLIIVR